MLKRRIDEAAKYIDLDQLSLSPQCGFASSTEGNRLTEDEQFAKLRLVVEVANEVWGRNAGSSHSESLGTRHASSPS
jgi:5-methyltetrahydropteroyltriglutamate--homocysteine methyltransferase